MYQSLGVYGIAKFTQQIIIRHLGAQLLKTLLACRRAGISVVS